MKKLGLMLALCVAMVLAASSLAAAELIYDVEVVEGQLVPWNPVGGHEPLGCGQTIYECTGGNYFYSSSLVRNVLDDGAFPTGTGPVCVSCIRFAWYQRQQQQLYIVIDFWDTLNRNTTPVNTNWLGGVIVDFGVVPVGGWISADLELPQVIQFPDDDWGVQMRFLRLLSPPTWSTVAHTLFANGGPTVGSNDHTIFWWDANNDGVFASTEAYKFSDPNKSQFYFWIAASAVPSGAEEGTWGGIKALFR